jgi:DNA-binding MarR family transcriptional regulator
MTGRDKMNLTPTETKIVNALASTPEVTGAKYRYQNHAAGTLQIRDLVEQTGASEQTVKKAIRSLEDKGLVTCEARRHSRMRKSDDVRIYSDAEREENQRRSDRGDAGEALEQRMKREHDLGKWSSRIDVRTDRSQDNSYGLGLYLDGLTKEQVELVLRAVTQVAPDCLKSEDDED